MAIEFTLSLAGPPQVRAALDARAMAAMGAAILAARLEFQKRWQDWPNRLRVGAAIGHALVAQFGIAALQSDFGLHPRTVLAGMVVVLDASVPPESMVADRYAFGDVPAAEDPTVYAPAPAAAFVGEVADPQVEHLKRRVYELKRQVEAARRQEPPADASAFAAEAGGARLIVLDDGEPGKGGGGGEPAG